MPEWIEIPVAVAIVLGVLGWLFTPADPKFNAKPTRKDRK